MFNEVCNDYRCTSRDPSPTMHKHIMLIIKSFLDELQTTFKMNFNLKQFIVKSYDFLVRNMIRKKEAIVLIDA